MSNVLQICPDYFHTSLYSKLFLALNETGVESKVYVPEFYPDNKDGIYTVDRNFGKLERLLFFGKQKYTYYDISEKISLSSIDCVHAHFLFSAGYSAYKIHEKKGIPYIVAVRNTDVNVFFKYMFHLREIGCNILKCAEKIIFLSPAYKNFVCNKYIPSTYRDSILKKSLVVPNGIDPIFFENKSCHLSIEKNKRIKLIYIGSVNANKNIELQLKACCYLLKLGYEVSLEIVGEICKRKYYNIFSSYPFVKYHPKASHQEIISYLRNADIFIMVSYTETFGLVYPEAMSQGLPVIYSRGQGFDGYFSDGEIGYGVDCNDYEMLADRILCIYNDYENISKRCTEYVDRFDWKSIAEIYKKIYLEIIK